MWAVLKQLLSTNWLNKSAVKGEVSLVSCRNFLVFVLWGQNDMTCVSPYPEFCSGCFAKFELSVVKWHKSRHFPFLCHCFEDKQGISLTTWMVVSETDKWNINFEFFLPFFFVVHHVECKLFRNGILLFWRKQINPFVLIVFVFFWAFVFVTKIYICPKDLLLLSISNEMS